MAFVNRTVQHAFPAIPLYEALGNNDTETDDYAAQGRSLLAALGRRNGRLLRLVQVPGKDFLLGGYYAVPHPTVPSQELIVLEHGLLVESISLAQFRSWFRVELKWLASEPEQRPGKTQHPSPCSCTYRLDLTPTRPRNQASAQRRRHFGNRNI